MPPDSPSSQASGFAQKSGVRFFGDIHGCFAEFDALAEQAIARNLHLHSLGDLIDRGPDSPGCMRLACDLHDAGWLDVNPGNHDLRFARWHRGEKVPVKPNNLGSTLAQLEAAPDGAALARRYFDLMMAAPLWSRFGRIYAVHAALDAEMLGRDGPLLKDADWDSPLVHFAVEGEERDAADPQRWELGRRSFNWLDRVPPGVTVLIGHSVASVAGPRERRNADPDGELAGQPGGRIVQLDTGLERGGKLSFLDVPMDVIQCLDEPTIAAFPQATDFEIKEARKLKKG